MSWTDGIKRWWAERWLLRHQICPEHGADFVSFPDRRAGWRFTACPVCQEKAIRAELKQYEATKQRMLARTRVTRITLD